MRVSFGLAERSQIGFPRTPRDSPATARFTGGTDLQPAPPLVETDQADFPPAATLWNVELETS